MGWVVNATPRPLYPGKDPVSIVWEAGWTPGPVWTSAENLARTGIRSSDRPARCSTISTKTSKFTPTPDTKIAKYLPLLHTHKSISHRLNFLTFTRSDLNSFLRSRGRADAAQDLTELRESLSLYV